jgi:hypothetical protein
MKVKEALRMIKSDTCDLILCLEDCQGPTFKTAFTAGEVYPGDFMAGEAYNNQDQRHIFGPEWDGRFVNLGSFK